MSVFVKAENVQSKYYIEFSNLTQPIESFITHYKSDLRFNLSSAEFFKRNISRTKKKIKKKKKSNQTTAHKISRILSRKS